MHVHVAIVGLDRISTSVGLALKRYQGQPKAEHTFTIIGSDSSAAAMKAAERLQAVDNFHRGLLKATDKADVVIMNAPLSKREETYARLGPTLKAGAVVLDLGSLKQPAVGWANTHFPRNNQGAMTAYLVGMTPIINAAHLYNADPSAEAASAEAFDGAEILIAPDAACPSEAISLAEDITRLLGGKPRFMDPAEHDGLIMATEALPALLGVTLFYTLQQSEGWPDLRRMVNPALALATQNLRHQTPHDLLPLLAHNRENLAHHLESFIGVLDQMRDILVDESDPDHDKLSALLSVAYGEWEKWDVKRHSGQWDDVKHDLEPMPGMLGSIGGMFMPRRRPSDDKDED
ncbi:MAG: prephenate dehydrogenase/arogenate dehydrogenase family protein [Anaerolineae bacterium]|nr:prephenate dehydrogenase/arogenate dehydrogenase family protein [Anaerolineae bacterium]